MPHQTEREEGRTRTPVPDDVGGDANDRGKKHWPFEEDETEVSPHTQDPHIDSGPPDDD